MWLILLLVVLFVLAAGAGGWGQSRYGYWGWSPAGVILVVAVVLFFTGHLAVGCAPTEANAAVEKPPPTASDVQLGKVKTETKEAAKAAEVFAYARKVEFVANMKRELAAIQVESERLSARVEKSNAKEKADAVIKLAAMREQWVRTSEQRDLAQNADEPSWDAMRSGYEKSYADLKDSFDQTRQWLSDKIEP